MIRLHEIKRKFGQLITIMEKLRSNEGCPWDREQTHKTLRQYLLEETYEVLELLDAEKYTELKNELGDLLLQIIFHAQIATESNLFTIEDILDTINRKLIKRHPNVFGNVKINTAEEQTVNWEQIKLKEGKKSIIDGVPKQLPALLRAHRIQAKAATVGFDWKETSQVWSKVQEEILELKHAIHSCDHPGIEDEFGDVLFSMVNLARFIKVNPEAALRKAIDKFIKRFNYIEEELQQQGKLMKDCNLNELDLIWEKAKDNKNK